MFDYETIAKAFPDTKKDYPWFPDRPKLFLSAMGSGNSYLLSFCLWNDEHLPTFLDFMKSFLGLSSLAKKELLEIFHANFVMIVVHVWMIDCILDKIEEENLYPNVTKAIRKKMHKLLEDAIRIEVQGDSLWLGEHADWWVPKQRVSRQKRKEK